VITFFVCLAILVAGYFLYAPFIDKIFGPNDEPTPALAKTDGVDFVPMSTPNIFLIQLLNIAGLGPIFGAISGALWGPAAFLWITFGTIFAGGVHDYFFRHTVHASRWSKCIRNCRNLSWADHEERDACVLGCVACACRNRIHDGARRTSCKVDS